MTKSQISLLIPSLIHTTILILSHIKYCSKSLGNISPNFESKFIITATVSRPYTQETKIQKNGGLSRKNIIYFTFTDTKFEVLFVKCNAYQIIRTLILQYNTLYLQYNYPGKKQMST